MWNNSVKISVYLDTYRILVSWVSIRASYFMMSSVIFLDF